MLSFSNVERQMQRVPTVYDLRVKECYICREEEFHDRPAEPPRNWVHPCKCTLIAHEDCLLEWIRASEKNPEKPLSSILKCPQCGERYRIESNNPPILRVMDYGNSIIRKSGSIAAILTVAAGVTSIGTGIYVFCTGYGAFAVHQFLGSEMFNLVLGADFGKWPSSAFFTLPLIPVSLVLTKTKRYRKALPLITLMNLWPSIPAVIDESEGQGFLSFLGLGARVPWALPPISQPATVSKISTDLFRDLFFSWPPSPFMFHIGLTIVRSYYGRLIERLRSSVLGDAQEDAENNAGGIVFRNFRMEVLIERGDADAADAGREQNVDLGAQPVAQNHPANNQADLQDDNNVQLVLDAADERPAPVADRPAEPAPIPERHQPQPEVQGNAAAGNADLPVNGALEGRVRQAELPPNANRNQAEDRGGNAAAPLLLELTTSYIGSIVGGALIVPPLSSFAGSVLLRLALPRVPNAHKTLNFTGYPLYHPRRLLCRFLGVRPPGAARGHPLTALYTFGNDMPFGELMRSMMLLSCRAVLIGTPTWTDSDPVWWRNALGLGIFYVAKDLLSIWYEYLSRREIRSRRVRDRAFDEINPSELDLIPEFYSTPLNV